MPFKIIRNDITKVEVDAIVNAANPRLKMGAGVCGAIFSAAGKEKLQKACDEIGHCDDGNAVITDGFKLPAKFIIHTVGPVWGGGDNNEDEILFNAYWNSMELAIKNNCSSIAFPLISSGYFGYPKKEAFQVAIRAIGEFLDEYEMSVYLVVFDKDSLEISEKRLYEVKKFIDDNYVNEKLLLRRQYKVNEKKWIDEERSRIDEILIHEQFEKASAIESFEPNLEETFSQRLLRLIDERGFTDPQIYNRAYITRKHFSKIRNNPNYQPKKKTAISLAIALLLSIEDMLVFLKSASFTLSDSIMSDVIIQYHIKAGIYDVFQINEMLLGFDQEPLV